MVRGWVDMRKDIIIVALAALTMGILFGCIFQPPLTNQTNITNQTNVTTGNISKNVTFFNQSLTANASSFIEAGCVKEDWRFNCSGAGLEEKFSCESIREADNLGGLTPNVPIVTCAFEKKDQDEPGGISRLGCLIPIYNKYIVLDKGEFKAINTSEEFKQFFAPVETRAEALSYAVALTGAYPRYNANIPAGYRTFVSDIKPTYVEETSAGYIVHLFDYQSCGCGPHPYYTIDYLVTKSGSVTEISSQKLYEDPQYDNLCVD